MTLSPIKVLYEDDDYIVFDKPSGLLVIPSPEGEKRTLVQLVNEQHGPSASGRLYPCHRLDRDTSGAIIFAKGKKRQQLLMREFQKGTVAKRYLALVRGRLSPDQGEIRRPVHDFHEQRFQRRHTARFAITRYRVKAIRPGYSIVEVYPLTGRTNQIRIHFRDIGHPLLGERLYAFGKDFPVKFRRLALHAMEVIFRHPILKKTIKVNSSLPEDMANFIQTINKGLPSGTK